MISKSFLKSSFIYSVAGALPMVSGIILLPFYTNYLSVGQYVSLGLYISLSMLFQVLFSYSIESYFGVKYTQLSDHPEKQRKFVGTVSNVLLIIGPILLGITTLIGPSLFPKIFDEDIQVYFWPFGFLSVLTAFFNSYFKTCTHTFIYFNKPELFFGFNITNFFITILFSLVGLYMYPQTLNGPIYGRLLSGIVIFFMSFWFFYKQSKFEFEKSFLKDIHKFCIPFVIYVTSTWVFNYIDRYFLQSYIPEESLAAYDLILKCFLGVEFLQNGLMAAIFPKIFKIWNDNKKNETTPESNRYFNVFTVVNIVILIGFCIAAPFVYYLFIKKTEYYQSFNYIGVLAAGYATRSILNFYIATILYSKNIWLLVRTFGLGAIFQAVITYFLVKGFGLAGALYGGILTKIIQVVICATLTEKTFVYKFNPLKIFGLPFIYMITNVVIYFFIPGYNIWIYLTQFFLFPAIFFLIFKNEMAVVYLQFFGKKKEN
jgi:O-antigen/teichoic acid export membrane protein